MLSPLETYRRRLSQREVALVELKRRDSLLSNSRLAVAGAGLLLVWPTLFIRWLDWRWLLLPVALFAGLAVFHGAVIKRRQRAARATRLYASGIERLENRWHGNGRGGHRFLSVGHPYAADLDLLGDGSLFELLNTTRTVAGEETLAGWLLDPGSVPELLARHQAVDELRPQLDFREELALLGAEVSHEIDASELAAWGASAPVFAGSWPVVVAAIAAVVNLSSLIIWWRFPWGSLMLVPGILASGALTLLWRRRVAGVLGRAARPRRELLLYAELLRLLEAGSWCSPRLSHLQAELGGSGDSASRRIRQLARLVEWNESRRNVLFTPIAAILMLGSQLAFAVERWRGRSGPRVGAWLAAVGELEALASLARFAYENPEHPFPEFTGDGALFDARGLGHPLLAATSRVRNDLRLGGGRALLLVSGSNMSGKSTLLRSVGANAVLAFAGAPVCARGLVLGPLTIGASIRVSDSLQDGTSRFYAEIQRLKQLSELGSPEAPLLFLLDEILHGTNSHDRRIGAEGVIAGLLAAGGVGLVTTHDLVLSEIADGLGSRAANVHFEDQVEDGRMRFDYKLRAGVVEKSNALDLMRGLGLKV